MQHSMDAVQKRFPPRREGTDDEKATVTVAGRLEWKSEQRAKTCSRLEKVNAQFVISLRVECKCLTDTTRVSVR